MTDQENLHRAKLDKVRRAKIKLDHARADYEAAVLDAYDTGLGYVRIAAAADRPDSRVYQNTVVRIVKANR